MLVAWNGAAVAEDAYYTFETTKNTTNTGYATNYDVTIENMKWSVPGNQNFDGYVRIGGKELSGIDRNIYSKTAMGSAIGKIVINHNGRSNENLIVNSITLYVADNANFTNPTSQKLTPEIGAKTTGTVEFTGDWATGSYYKFVINVSNAITKNNYGLDVKSIQFFAAEAPTDIPAPKFTPDAGTYTGGTTVTIECESEPQGEYVISYTTDGSDPKTSETAEEYENPITVDKTTTIKAVTMTADGFSNVKTSTYTILKDPTNTPEGAYTVAEAKAIIIDGGYDLTKEVYVKGRISQIDDYLSTYKAITYWISEDGTTGDQFKVYKGKGVEGADFSSKDDLKLRSEVIIHGTIGKNGTVYQFNENNTQYSYNPPAQCAVRWSVNGAETVTSQSQGDALDFPSDPDIISGYSFRGWTADASVETTGEGITYLGEGATVPGQESVTYYAVFAKASGTINTDSYSNSQETEGWTKSVDSKLYSDYPKFKLSTTGHYVASPTYGSPITEFSFTFKGWSISGNISKLEVKGKGKDGVETLIKTYETSVIPSETTDETIQITSGEYYSIKVEYTKGKGNVAIDNFAVKYGATTYFDYKLVLYIPTTIGTQGISSFCSEYALDFTGSGIEAYIATGVGEDNSVTLQQVTTVPAATGLILRGEEGQEAKVTVVNGDDIDTYDGNMLRPAFKGDKILASTTTEFRYAFGTKDGVKGFWKLTGDLTNSGNYAYLQSDTDYTEAMTGSARGLTLRFGGITTGVNGVEIETQPQNGGIYTVSGTKVQKPTKGLFIINGKKVVY